MWSRCLRVRVLIDVSKPLMRGSKVKFNGVSTFVLFRYEKLGDFRFVCGKLDHVDKDCPLVYAGEGEIGRVKKQYGPWLRAEGLRGAIVEEVSKGIITMGKIAGEGPSRADEDRVELEAGEQFAMQVMQVEPNQECRGGILVERNNTGGIECVIPGLTLGAGKKYELE